MMRKLMPYLGSKLAYNLNSFIILKGLFELALGNSHFLVAQLVLIEVFLQDFH